MDEIVLRGMVKWPKVPAVHGWLRLDRRGNWLIKDDRVSNPAIIAFIGRNYAHDDSGRWFFQNGPQRVFVTLDYTPYVYRVTGAEHGPLAIETHTGRAVQSVNGAWIDEHGALLLATDAGAGVVHDADLDVLLPQFVAADGTPLPEDTLDELMDLAQRGFRVPLRLRLLERTLNVEPLRSSEVPERFSFVKVPAPLNGECACE